MASEGVQFGWFVLDMGRFELNSGVTDCVMDELTPCPFGSSVLTQQCGPLKLQRLTISEMSLLRTQPIWLPDATPRSYASISMRRFIFRSQVVQVRSAYDLARGTCLC
jgi:hypothetical protein